MDIDALTKNLQLEETTARRLRSAFEAEFEAEKAERRRRQAEGIARAKARGVRFGRPTVEVKNIDVIYELYMKKGLTVTQAADMCGLPRSTIYRKLCEYEKQKRIG